MSAPNTLSADREIMLKKDEILVTKTDLRGVITYANSVFLRVAGYTEEETIGRPHNFIRHASMPACVFQLLWDTIKSGKEIFAYVLNSTKDGGHYWVLAHVTPTFDEQGSIVGYHSSRRIMNRTAVETISGIYEELHQIEVRHGNRTDGMQASMVKFQEMLGGFGLTYPEFIFSLQN